MLKDILGETLYNELAAEKGNFDYLPFSHKIRHKTVLTASDSMACPLNFLCNKRGRELLNTDTVLFETILKLGRVSTNQIIGAADNPFHPLRKELEELLF